MNLSMLTWSGWIFVFLTLAASLVFIVDCAALAGGADKGARSWPSSSAATIRGNALALGLMWAWLVWLVTP